MRVLHLAYRDTSGVPGRWAAAHRQAGLEVELLVEFPHPFAYGAEETVNRWSPGTRSPEERAAMLRPRLEWAEAVMAYDHPFYLDAAIASGKPVLFRALGQSSRERHEEIRELLQAPNVVRASAGTADLALLLGIELVGAPYGLLRRAESEGGVICHSPSDRASKGTERVLAAAKATGWKVDLVEGKPNAEVLARKRRADLVVDTCGPGTVPDGYGVSSVEAMAMGLPAVSSASAQVKEAWRELASPVVLVSDQDDLEIALELLEYPSLREELGEMGREFVERFHSPVERAQEDIIALSLVAA